MNAYADEIIRFALNRANPYENVKAALEGISLPQGTTVVAVGKAACSMGRAAYDALGGKIKRGFVLTKYSHSVPMPKIFTVREAGHPFPDENSLKYTEEILTAVRDLKETDCLLFLISGGASALFEKPLIPLKELRRVNEALLGCSADIEKINAVRKSLSAVKGGRFAQMCKCRIECCALSDVLGDSPRVIGSGLCFPDETSEIDPLQVLAEYRLDLGDDIEDIIAKRKNPKKREVGFYVAGNVKILCEAAAQRSGELGFESRIVTCELTGEAREQGRRIAAYARELEKSCAKPIALIYGGETTVTVRGRGRGGRNQELALAAAGELEGSGVTLFALGSDGTDGPTDAAGGIVDGSTASILRSKGASIDDYLTGNNSYEALKLSGGLIITGATGTNVNDLTVALINERLIK